MSAITVLCPVVTVLISVLALLVSGVRWYCGVHKRVKLRPMYQGAENEVRDGFDCRLEYQFCNTGNVGLRLKEVDVLMVPFGVVDPLPNGKRFYRCER